MNTKELLEAALKQAEKNGETMLVLHWNAGECQHMQTGDPAVIAGCMSMILGDGMSDDGKESSQSFALAYCVAGATIEKEGLFVCDTIKDMASEIEDDEPGNYRESRTICPASFLIPLLPYRSLSVRQRLTWQRIFAFAACLCVLTYG